MNNKQRKRQRDIKNKLMAAISMLLVSSIMMVSSTYAWFTLSTAPEVTGINTAVGANGNLEMALLPLTGDANAITTGTQDSTKVLKERNVTWGNLVDLSDNAYYGLNTITLYPAELNAIKDAAKNPTELAASMLNTPEYGSDGRISQLVDNTVTGTYGGTSFPQNDNFGVRAVGTANGMTARQLAYRNYRSAANTAMSQAKTAAAASLNSKGSALASIAIKRAASPDETYTQAEIQTLLDAVDNLLGKEGQTGVLQYIETAYRQNIIAMGASAAASLSDDQFTTLQTAVTEAPSLTEAVNALPEAASAFTAVIQEPITKLNGTMTNVQTAKTNLNNLLSQLKQTSESATATWDQLHPSLILLADPDQMVINGVNATEFKQNVDQIINSALTTGLIVTVGSGGGAYADVADHCGDYTASITLTNIQYGGITVGSLPATMKTATGVTPAVYLSQVGNAVTNGGAPGNEGSESLPISDLYGYVIDLAFRTNAAASNLKLQREAVGRIYNGETEGSEETMGHGSTMTFTATTNDFTADEMTKLMKAIRIVFFDPDTKAVMATAKLDTANATSNNDTTVTAEMYLYKKTAAGTTYVQEDYSAGSGKTYYTREGDNYSEAASPETALSGSLYVRQTVPAGEQPLADNVITALPQNTAKKVSVLVYLDGNEVTNGDVAATAPTSMTGTMNLQFASSATLVPMEYTPLTHQQAAAGGEGA